MIYFFFPKELSYHYSRIPSLFNFKLSNVFLEEKQNLEENILLKLEIPSINLKENVYDMNSVLNDVEYHVEILDSSNFDDNLFFLAAHSGNGSSSYFNDLMFLEKGDVVWIIYHNNKYSYVVDMMYFIPKNGYMRVDLDGDNTLYLITCSLESSDKQIVVQADLVGIEKYVN